MNYEPPFEKNQSIDDLTLAIVERVGEFNAASIGDTKPWLHRKMRIQTIHSSLAIEGNTLAENEVQDIVDGQRVLGNPKDILEVQNAIEAYDAIEAFDPCSIDDLLSAHKMMMQGLVKEAGMFRSSNVGVYDGDVLIHAGTPANYVPEVIADLFDWAENTNIHPLIASCIFHYEFEFIHPFADGNGRVGRLWHTLLLSKWRKAFKWLPIESIIFARQQDYYDALAKANDLGTSTPFVEFMLEVIKDSLDHWIHTEDGASKKEADALAFFKSNPDSTVGALAGYLGVSNRTAARVVKNLRESGRLKRIGSNKTGHWECI